MKFNKWMIFVLVGLLLALVVSVWQLSKNPVLTKPELEKRVTEIYGGTVQNIVFDDDEAIISFKRGEAMYEVEMDRRSGTFERLVVIFEPPATTNTPPSEILLTLITPEEANTVATAKYFGIVQSNDYVENGDEPYYIVKIASSTQRYVVHVAAKGGQITSVSIEQS